MKLLLTVTVASYLISGVLHRTSHHGPLSTSGHTCQVGSSSSSPSPSPRRKQQTQRSATRDKVSNVPTVTTRGEGSATDIQQVESTDAATRPTTRGAPDGEAETPCPASCAGRRARARARNPGRRWLGLVPSKPVHQRPRPSLWWQEPAQFFFFKLFM